MLCSIYKGSREQQLFLYVPYADGESNIPEQLRERMGEIKRVMTLKITPDRKLARADAEKVLKDIRDQGYYLQLPPEITGQVLYEGD